MAERLRRGGRAGTRRRLGVRVMTARSGRRSVAAWTAGALVLIVVVATTGFGGSVPALALRQAGHWVYNSTLGAVFHVNGGSKNVDARLALPGLGSANQVVQDSERGYVIDRRNGRVLIFSKSTLTVDSTLSTTGATEQPASLEVAGGPYLVYQHGGMIVRLGQPPASVAAGGQVGTPIATTDGTVWVQRTDTGAFCRLTPKSTELTCPAKAPAGHSGALTALDDHAAFVDTSADTVQRITAHGLGAPIRLGVDLPANAQVSGADAGGRLPVVTTVNGTPSMVLIDTSTVGSGKAGASPITVPLHDGRYDAPVTSGGTIALVDKTFRTVTTFTIQGLRKASTALPSGSGAVQVSRGEDGRIYVDNEAGTQTLVIDGDGTLTPVNVGGGATPGPPSTTPPTKPPTRPTSPPPSAPPTGVPEPRPSGTPPVPNPPASVPKPSIDVPGSPGPVTASAGDARALVTWAAPADDGGAPVAGYVLSWRGGSMSVSGDTLQATITGLTNGASYTCTVAAQNAAGRGPGTTSAPFVPEAVLSAPQELQVVASSDGTVTATWLPPAHSAGGVHYVVGVTGSDGSNRTIAQTTGTRVVANGLATGVRYQFAVTATDSTGRKQSATSRPVVPYRPATAPTGLKATPGTGKVDLSWNSAQANGGTIVGYRVSIAGQSDRVVAATSASIAGLAAGTTYNFTVRAITQDPNGSGKLDGSAASVSAKPSGELRLAQGAWTQEWCSPLPDCAWMQVELVGLQPNTSYQLFPHSSNPNYENEGDTVKTDGSGHAYLDQVFAYGEAGKRVWVTTTGPDGTEVKSNEITWQAHP